ncbi:MAG: chemotaxis protein CheW [Pseudomonadota bacterium]
MTRIANPPTAPEQDAATDAALLDDRARLLAKPVDDAADLGAELELVLFACGGARYGIETRFVHRVLPLPRLTTIAGIPSPFQGVMAWSGRILPVIALERLLEDVREAGSPAGGQLLILGDEAPELGLPATRVDRVARVPEASIQSFGDTGPHGALLVGICDDGSAVLDGRRLLDDPRITPQEPSKTTNSEAGAATGAPHEGRK